jgi:hypothetical protein
VFTFQFLNDKIYSYCTGAIITRGLHNLNPLFEGQKRFLSGFFCKILALCMVSIQERFIIKRGLLSRAGYDGARMQRASGDELRAAIDVGRKQYQPKQLKYQNVMSFSLFSFNLDRNCWW